MQAHRRLVAIVASDIVGYSRLIEADESATLTTIRELRRVVVDPLLAQHSGHTVKLMGDGAIFEFVSVVDAVAFATRLQEGVVAQQINTPQNKRIVLRVGVNVGDVVAEGDDLLGDGVNVAARLEQLCDPGSVLISGTAFDQLQGKLPFPIDFVGDQRVKNIARPVRTYRVRLRGTGRPWRLRARPYLSRRRLLAPLTALLLIGVAWIFWPVEDAHASRTIAVLPFDNLDGDARWTRLAEGLSEDIITDLARHPDIFVIARNSSFAYKGKSPDVRQVGRELGVRFVLEGSVQTQGHQLRVTAQFIDAVSGAHLWAQRYDQATDDLFSVQDEITARVVGSIASTYYGEIARSSRAVAKRKPPASLDAYDLYLIGMDSTQSVTKEGVLKGIEYLEKSVRMDPEFAPAWSQLGLAYSVASTLGFSDDVDTALRHFREDTTRALQLDPNDWIALGQRATLRAADGDIQGAKEDFERALAVAPNDADNLALIAYNMPLVVGDAKRMVDTVNHALLLNPSAPPWYYGALAIAQYVAGNDRDAITAAMKAPVHGESLMVRAMAHARLGDLEQAHTLVQRIRAEFPEFSVEGYVRTWPVTAPDALSAFSEGASKAGLIAKREDLTASRSNDGASLEPQ
ncbi:adenylate/guanylate cyclase domain-containing protein [Mesorhizobium sp. M4B.F.Ca.ET.215.01.1.1]|uniref:adenylate/guanylate cyclase domain-containing protein n=1 Tax=unclassified Mesorhizobium TaxID=325217 RepID=UPI000FCB7CD7|nr:MULTISPECIES: adenylate/guanylate cyclase domain-containing protein [unclassified Mesorhizobium]RUW19439.1 adenylate/guanylate cyclase domain-containing protein [Mesorhizobium sp. M4B.F.Ca.ET.013.02.1.1]RVD39184.1 adenylate/guanylate cyclase domain-containing protein [Mesorhizobium sp. M4B.F.Ca.ET.019.03.1.1]RWF63385.1 MAG: adenylate/guanylate cyclase domain-containing protein [Mesorhizobium sp.]TGQ10293.1 adenylate/guanylate cyclase domain-containing protein [Mesorhizobium sp. M4B.F.Ca.ET.2